MSGKFVTTKVLEEFKSKKNKEAIAVKNVMETYDIKDISILIELVKAELDEKSVILNAHSNWFSIGTAIIAIITAFFVSILGKDVNIFQRIFVPSVIIGLIIFMGAVLMYYRSKYQTLNRIYKELLIYKMHNN